MNYLSQAAAFLAAVSHLFFFYKESLCFEDSKVRALFGVEHPSEVLSLFAFNMGFYNLFLAIGVLCGLASLKLGFNVSVGQTLVLLGCFCMLGAGIVLFFSSPGGSKLQDVSILQGLFPLLACGIWFWRH